MTMSRFIRKNVQSSADQAAGIRSDLHPGWNVQFPADQAASIRGGLHPGWNVQFPADQATGIRGGVRLGWLVCCLLLLPVFPVWSAPSEPPVTSSKEKLPAPPETSFNGSDRGTEEIRAQLTSRQRTVLGAEITAKIQRINVTEGEAFPRGKLLVEFDCALFHTRLQKALAEVHAAQKRVEVHTRLMELGSLSPLELELDQAELARNTTEVTTQQIMVDRCHVRAPFPGQVIALQAQPFQYVTEGQHLLEILNNAELELAMIVPSRWLSRLLPGTPLTVHIDETGRDYPAQVVRPVPQVEAVSQSIKVIGRLDGQFPELISGMNGRVLFPETTRKSKP